MSSTQRKQDDIAAKMLRAIEREYDKNGGCAALGDLATVCAGVARREIAKAIKPRLEDAK